MVKKTDKKAIIDIGSNSIRLIVYSYNSAQGLVEHHNFKTVARLSMHIHPDGHLSEEGINILVRTLSQFKELLVDMHIDDVFAAATAAIRQASNQLKIIKIVESKIGITLHVLSEQQEAYFGYLAVIHSTNIPTAITIDMGGGSTELTYFMDKKLIHSHSFPFGVVSLRRQFMRGDTLTDEEKIELVKFVTDQFKSQEWVRKLQVPIIGIGGSARNIAQVDQQKKDNPLNGIHQYELKREDLREISDRFAQCSLQDLKKMDGLSSDRSDIIVPAIETFRTFMDIVEAPLFIYSKKGLREGIIFSQLANDFPSDFHAKEVTKNSIRHLLGKFHLSNHEVTHLYNVFHRIYTYFCEKGYIVPIQIEDFLRDAYHLFHIGRHIDKDAVSQHTFYLLTNLTIDGVSNDYRLKLALLASYQNRDTYKRYVHYLTPFLSDKEYKQLRDIGALFRFVHGLNVLGRRTIKDVILVESSREVIMTFKVTGNYLLEKHLAEKYKKHIGKVCGKEVRIEFKHVEETI